MLTLSNKEIIHDIYFFDNTVLEEGCYSFQFTTYDAQGEEILEYGGNIQEWPTGGIDVDYDQPIMPNDWQTVEGYIINGFINWKNIIS